MVILLLEFNCLELKIPIVQVLIAVCEDRILNSKFALIQKLLRGSNFNVSRELIEYLSVDICVVCLWRSVLLEVTVSN